METLLNQDSQRQVDVDACLQKIHLIYFREQGKLQIFDSETATTKQNGQFKSEVSEKEEEGNKLPYVDFLFPYVMIKTSHVLYSGHILSLCILGHSEESDIFQVFTDNFLFHVYGMHKTHGTSETQQAL